jgi:hypothetical protein
MLLLGSTQMKERIPRQCPGCGLYLLYGHIFDACDKREEFGPILGIDENAEPKTAKAGYVGIGSMWLYDQAPDLYLCPRCHIDPIAAG